MLAAGRIIRMGLSATTSSGPSGESKVVLAVNGGVHADYLVTKPDSQYTGTTTFPTPLEVSEGDRINFRSASANNRVTKACVSLLIELDL